MGAANESAWDLDQLTAPVRTVETLALDYLARCDMPANLRDAIEYALLGGGKRLRPVLVLWSCAAVGGEVENRHAHAAAAAVEMIHAFSLVHDDLPAMDDDDLRRGRPTLHKKAGEAMAILAGDAMMPLAISLITSEISPASLACRLIEELCQATNDMISGQVYDTMPRFDPGTTSADQLTLIHRNKTGSLLRASCRMGGLCGKATAQQLDALERYAQSTGLMFQIVDDLLDVTATVDQVGKAVNKDADRGKLTYPGVFGIDASRAEVQRLRNEAVAALAPLGRPAEPLRQLCDFLTTRQH